MDRTFASSRSNRAESVSFGAKSRLKTLILSCRLRVHVPRKKKLRDRRGDFPPSPPASLRQICRGTQQVFHRISAGGFCLTGAKVGQAKVGGESGTKALSAVARLVRRSESDQSGSIPRRAVATKPRVYAAPRRALSPCRRLDRIRVSSALAALPGMTTVQPASSDRAQAAEPSTAAPM